ncbi:ankyrin repeat domain-containing protein [Halarcobacter ebronensis]|uniref:Uncharacterized protein n=1 Tax=Halarcobacter ebronensis TaxID=1462615 RepID=A0A4Q1AMU7_9BACT|nr:ankyrin repeat domain-containing protein [Halarcobacter ebronensis]QKF83217.1 ankyrin domain-containing protein [Halarcobacter ebronensis]RXK05146.1 hypothetical protein CRV07_09020 [Halarcobacter ebronensis]
MNFLKNFALIVSILLFSACSNSMDKISINSSSEEELLIYDLIREKNISGIDKFLADNKNLNIKDKHGYTPLHIAVRLNQLRTVEKLYKSGATLNSRDVYGDTPLIDSVRNDSKAVSRFLICNGAKKDIKDRFGKTALDYALKNRDLYTVSLLNTEKIEQMCKPLEISIETYNKSENKICGKIVSGFASDIDLTLSPENGNTSSISPIKATLEDNIYCVDVDNNIEESANFLTTVEATNGIDTVVLTKLLSEIRD